MNTQATALISLTDYDANWPGLFEAEAPQIASALQLPRASIEHVGSTAVPGLRSKALIDIVVTVPQVGDRDVYLAALEPLGYNYREVHDPGRLFYEKRQPYRYHIHLVQENGWHFWRMILFRDRLRTDPLMAAAYVELKRRLADQYPDNRDGYSGGKSQFVTRTVQAELRRHPQVLAELRAKGAPVDVPFKHKRDPDTESFPLS